jgi:hypothetical protein
VPLAIWPICCFSVALPRCSPTLIRHATNELSFSPRTRLLNPPEGSAKALHHGTDNVLCRERSLAKRAVWSTTGPGEYIRVFYIAHANSGCLLEHQPDLVPSQQPKFPVQATRARNFPRLLIAPGSWMSCCRAMVVWPRRRANLETTSPHIRLMFPASLREELVGPARATITTGKLQRSSAPLVCGFHCSRLPYRCFTVLAWPPIDGRYTKRFHFRHSIMTTVPISQLRNVEAADPVERRIHSSRIH